MHRHYGDRVAFLGVYVREAHPIDGWRMASNDAAGIAVKQPRDKEERTEVARKCCKALGITMPVVIDEMNDWVGHLYSGMPDRLYVIDADSRVAYKSGRGPFGFKPGEMEQALALTLLDKALVKQSQGRFPPAKDEDAWKRLPAAEQGGGGPLPAWARALADALPRTTAAMLELDYLHRAKSPLGPKLAGRLRWVAAHANHCEYSEAFARADLLRAGLKEEEIAALDGDLAGLPEAERAALRFARKLTLAADTVTDAEVARLMDLHGDKQVVAMVLLLAHANFQDRLLLALGLSEEPGGPLPPPAVRFTKPVGDDAPPVPPRKPPAAEQPLRVRDLEPWAPRSFADLQKEMDGQRARQGRIAVPPWAEVREKLPSPPERPLRIKWSLVCLGYQPELASAWSACTRAFGQEAKQDRVFEESLFWVVTRSLNCFY